MAQETNPDIVQRVSLSLEEFRSIEELGNRLSDVASKLNETLSKHGLSLTVKYRQTNSMCAPEVWDFTLEKNY